MIEIGLYGYELEGSIFIVDKYLEEEFRSASITTPKGSYR